MSEAVLEQVAESVPEGVVDLSNTSIEGLKRMLGGDEAGAMVPDEVEETPVSEAKPAKADKPKAETEPDSETDDDQEQADGEDKAPTQRGINKKFAKLTGKIRDLETQLANRPAAAVEVKPGVATQPAANASEPVAADFDTYEAYVKALTKFEIAEAAKAETAKTATKTMAESWKTRVAEAKAEIPDYAGEADIPISPIMNAAILRHPKGAYIADFLGRNPDDAKRISALDPVDAAVEIGVIAAGLKTATPETKKPAPVVKALPKPPAVVGGSSTPTPKSTDLNNDDLSVADFTAQARKQLKRPTF